MTSNNSLANAVAFYAEYRKNHGTHAVSAHIELEYQNMPKCPDCDLNAIYHLADGGYGCIEHNFVCTECNNRFMTVNRDVPNVDICYGCGCVNDNFDDLKTVPGIDSKDVAKLAARNITTTSQLIGKFWSFGRDEVKFTKFLEECGISTAQICSTHVKRKFGSI